MKPVITIAITLAALTGCRVGSSPENEGEEQATGLIRGETEVLYGAEVESWVRLDREGEVLEVGATLDLAMVEGLLHPEDEASAKHEDEGEPGATVAFPEEAAATFFHHLNVSPFPQGVVEAPPYDVPFFAFHFMGIDYENEAGIDCVGEPEAPAPERIPEDYLYLGPGAFPLEGGCIPEDGVHAADLTRPEHQDPPGEFTFNPFLGFHMGEIVHLEPLVGGDFMMAEKDFHFEPRRPELLGRTTLFPGRFDARFDAEAETWELVWSDFSPIE